MRSIKYCLFLLSVSLFVISCNHTDSLFENLSPSSTNINFVNTPVNKKAFGILYYLYYYNGGGVSTGDINNDGLPDIYFTANSPGKNKLYLNKGNFKFEDITEKAGVAGNADWCSGVTMADVNGDGFLDIYVSAVANHHGLQGRNELFINNGNNSFTESAVAFGLGFSGFSTQAAFFDFDHDGDLDCYLLNQSHKPNENIIDTSNRRKPDANAGDRLYRNDGKTFTDISAAAGIYQSSLGYGLGLAVADLNNDGWDDIYVGNDFHENDYYYVNNGNGTFTESGASAFGHYSRFSMGNDAADYNNDGQIDLVTVDMLPFDEKVLKSYGSDENPDIYKFKLMRNGFQYQYSKNCLQRNNGNALSFSETSLLSGVSATDWSWAPLFADFDNDGNKDLFISSGIVKRPVDLDYVRFVSELSVHKTLNQTDKYDQVALDKMPDGSSHPFFFRGNGTLRFDDVSDAWGTGKMKGYFNGAAYADLNNDGNLDLIMNCLDAPAIILKNNSPQKNFISIAFKGNDKNKNGIGAKAYIFTAGKMQYQQLMPTRGFQSSVDLRLHFGTDSSSTIDSILIVWPDQKYQTLRKIPAGKQLTVSQQDAAGVFSQSALFPPAPSLLTVMNEQEINLPWKHKENDFFDNNVQYLIPHGESARGPKMAVADVNHDGLDDLFACGAKGQPGSLMIQQNNGSFLPSDSAVFNADAAAEDVDAIFFDANNDGSPDLYVVSGGNEYTGDNILLEDRLYINDSKGHFTKSTNALPPLLENKSCVAVADVDHDGDNDIFVGNLANAKAYGIPQSSYLLLNDGKGRFTIAGQSIAALANIGMVTTAAFEDLNKDGWKDLVITGEWMPVKIYMNNKGIFKATDLKESTGLWQSVFVADVNADGFPDLLAGNWGLNSKFSSGKNGPLKLYVKDFDKNGSVEQILTYNINGKEYPFLAKDELERALPVLKKAYLTYSEVAGQTVSYMFDDLFKDYVELKAETLSSTCFINDGKGNFTSMPMPDDLQLAPIFSFAAIPTASGSQFITGGNFYTVIPYEGRYDALMPTVFSYSSSQSLLKISKTFPGIRGEVRDIKWIKGKDGNKTLIIARNNDKPVFLKPAK
jgi:hypothetical protein